MKVFPSAFVRVRFVIICSSSAETTCSGTWEAVLSDGGEEVDLGAHGSAQPPPDAPRAPLRRVLDALQQTRVRVADRPVRRDEKSLSRRKDSAHTDLPL